MSTNQVIQKTTLFVGDLSIFCTENDLIEAFTPFGTVVEVKIMRCEETNKNLCYGFVKFANAASSIQAMQEMNGRLLSGRPLRISWASHRLKKGSFGTCSVSDAHGNNSSSLHIHYSATQIEKLITEEDLRKTFSKYGEVLDITVKKYELDEHNQIQRGYGFVHFPPNVSGILSALKCCEDLKDIVLDDVHYKCEISHKLLNQLVHRHDPEVLQLIHKYYPGGTQELKEKAIQQEGVSKGLTIQTTFPPKDSVNHKNRNCGQRCTIPHPVFPFSPFQPTSLYPLESVYYEQTGFGFTATGNSTTISSAEVVPGAESTSFNSFSGWMTSTNVIEANTKAESDSGDSSTTNVFSFRELAQGINPPLHLPVLPPWSPQSTEPSPSSPPFYAALPSPMGWPYMISMLPYTSNSPPLLYSPFPIGRSFRSSFNCDLPHPPLISPPRMNTKAK